MDSNWAQRLWLGWRVVRGIPLFLLNLLLTPLAWLLAQMGFRFLYSNRLLSRIGHLAMEPTLFIKMGLLGLRPNYRAVILAPRGRVVNPCLLDYWRRYIKVIDHPWLVALLCPLSGIWCIRYNTRPDEHLHIQLPDGRRFQGGLAVDEMEWRYETQFGHRALLTLSDSHAERGWQCLAKWGVPRGAWFVCLHVRESGYGISQGSDKPHRNADVFTYLTAVEEIVQRGGWVIRVGDPAMKPVPHLKGLIDYAHTDVRSDWMDVFCLSQCRFCLASTSGLWSISYAFGRPVVGANWIPMGHGLNSAKDIYIPKLYLSLKERRFLRFSEILLSPLRMASRVEQFANAGATWVDNTPEEIRDVTVEMLDRLDGKLQYTPEDERQQERYKALLRSRPTIGTHSRVGRDFLRKYQGLLEDLEKEDTPAYPDLGRGVEREVLLEET